MSVFDDLDKLRLSQDFRESLGVSKVLSTVPVRKPNRQEFFRIRDDDAYRLDAGILKLEDDNESYLLSPAVREALPGDWKPSRLQVFLTRQGVLGVWPLTLPDPQRPNAWHASALMAAARASSQWVKLAANQPLGAYDFFVAEGELGEPEWPGYTFKQILEIAFRDGRYIDNLEHPVIQRLRGRV